MDTIAPCGSDLCLMIPVRGDVYFWFDLLAVSPSYLTPVFAELP
jgi:hypothetical protein